jgi:hypothetical protein
MPVDDVDDVVPDEDREVELVVDDQDPGAQTPVDPTEPEDDRELVDEPERPA